MKIRALVFLALALSACGGSAGKAKTPAPSKFKGPLAYYPFEPGTQWSFMVYGPPGTPGLLKVDKVVAFDGQLALVQSGEATLTYRVAPEGIYREPSHVFLLKWPIVLGDSWTGAKGSKVEVTKTDVKMTVEAGTFEGCAEITERIGGDAAGLLRTTFCPDVGPVLVEIHELNAPPGELPQRLIGRLRAYGPPVQLGK
ncbi:MAG: hypothetical protein HYV09_28080 [Deltaproteobacteria bacterium]|nr:hypothetical protein [Deltaproteobacteria bacterium]